MLNFLYHLEVLLALSFYVIFSFSFTFILNFGYLLLVASANDLSVQPEFRGGYLAFALPVNLIYKSS